MQEYPGRWRALRLIGRGLRLRCPRCNAPTLFRGWFSMNSYCAVCHLRFEREQGYFIGAMYVNYGFTVALVISGYFLLEWLTDVSLAFQLVLWGSVSIVCPLILFRQARGLWLGFDYIFNPAEEDPPEDHVE